MIRLIFSIISGAIVGWLAGQIMDSSGGWLRNIILGIAGSFVGSLLAGLLGISATGIGSIIISVAGACLVIFLVRKFAK